MHPYSRASVAPAFSNRALSLNGPGQHLPQQFSVDRVVGLLEVDEAHMYSGIFLCQPSSWSRRTTNSMSMVDRAGRKPHCSSGSICCASQKSLRRLATIFSSTLPAWETSEIPRKLLQSDWSDFLWSTFIVASFYSCGISSPLHTRTSMAWKCLRRTGWRVRSSSLSSFTGSESAPGAFQFAIARTAFCISLYVGTASGDIDSYGRV